MIHFFSHNYVNVKVIGEECKKFAFSIYGNKTYIADIVSGTHIINVVIRCFQILVNHIYQINDSTPNTNDYV